MKYDENQETKNKVNKNSEDEILQYLKKQWTKFDGNMYILNDMPNLLRIKEEVDLSSWDYAKEQ